MEYNFRDIEKNWQQWWKENKIYKVSNDSPRPKYYVLDMFPYPSGAGLHVGHPLGYIASDIYARFKRLKGFNVLHPMGYDAFGLPAEQYAIEHGIHPAVSTENNINNFRKQLDNIGFCFDWDREVRTSDPKFYKWTQWIFLQLFHSFYNRKTNRAEPISDLIAWFEKEGNKQHTIPNTQYSIQNFSAGEWKNYDEKTQQDILMQYRLAYCGYGEVNWCEALGTVLANDEVINGVSERGGHPVVKKKLRQWYLRITEYADRLLEGLQKVDFSDSMKEMQSNWIGKSSGAEIDFDVKSETSNVKTMRVYTTRPDTIFGVDFMVVAPEMEMVNEIKSKEQAAAVDEYLAYVKSRSERERMAEKKITGVFTGAYALNPFNKREIPIWISEYVLAGYGTGAIMAVPCGDERDHKFAKHFNIPITNIIGSHYNGEEANATKDAILENSDFINGMVMKDAIEVVIKKIEEKGIGVRKVNYKMRDAAFSRQRYWGEPFPIVWKDGIACPLDESELPVVLPHMDELKPGEEAEGPLWNLHEWKNYKDGIREVNTMPGYAGSSWYFLRYMDPHNDKVFCDRKASDYWGQVDLYIGGTEHAVGHLLYSRMWTKFLYDIGMISHDEPYKRLVNQGMIQGSSRFIYRYMTAFSAVDKSGPSPTIFISKNIVDQLNDQIISEKVKGIIRSILANRAITTIHDIEVSQIHIDVNIVDGLELDIEKFTGWKNNINSYLILDDFSVSAPSNRTTVTGKYMCGSEVEKMSKSKLNTVNPDDLVLKYGADTFRMYEMFLGPVEMSKPWDTKGIEGVHRFLRKLWRLFYDELKGKVWNNEKANDAELKVLHKTIKKIEEDTERFSFNTGVSTFMICVNDLTDLKCYKKEVLEQLLILLAPYAPHISEELWSQLGNSGTILDQTFPKWNDKYLKETSKAYPVAINGKTRTELTLALDATQQQVEEIVLKDVVVTKWLEGRQPKKIIYVKNKMINVVV
jgi:leucyl-tRNA synthetase